jgi:transcriptional regulator with XRE-family HTH domain
MSIYEQRTLEAIRYGARITEARRECEWSKDELAKRAGVTRADVWQFEAGYSISEEARAKILRILNEEFEP